MVFFFYHKNQKDASDDGTTETGLGYAFILLGSTLVFQCMVQVHNFMLLFKTGMDVRTILCACIYEKALTIASSEKTKLTVGGKVGEGRGGSG
jgi:uncharacterized membrane protein YadS